MQRLQFGLVHFLTLVVAFEVNLVLVSRRLRLYDCRIYIYYLFLTSPFIGASGKLCFLSLAFLGYPFLSLAFLGYPH